MIWGRPITVQLTVLGSGSGGNATLLACGGDRLLIDVGLSCRELTRRLQAVRVEPESIQAIVLTHGHADHVKGAAPFSRRYGVPVYSTAATRDACGTDPACDWRPLSIGRSDTLCGFSIDPFRVPHDAVETLAFRIGTPEGVIVVATDVGEATHDLVERCKGCVALVIESNHAVELLRVGPYASSVKERIASPSGHLSNEALAIFVARHMDASVRCVVLAHLSRVNNTPEIAEMNCREALVHRGLAGVRIIVTRQDRPSETIDLAALSVQPVSPRYAVAPVQHGLPFA